MKHSWNTTSRRIGSSLVVVALTLCGLAANTRLALYLGGPAFRKGGRRLLLEGFINGAPLLLLTQG